MPATANLEKFADSALSSLFSTVSAHKINSLQKS